MLDTLKTKMYSPQEDPSTALASEEEISSLKALIESTRNRVQKIQNITEGDIEGADQEVFNSFIKTMRDAGVDTSNPDQIDAFIEDIRSRSPELADIFEQTLLSVAKSQNLINGDESETPTESTTETAPQDIQVPQNLQTQGDVQNQLGFPEGEMTDASQAPDVDLSGLQ